MSAPPTSQRTGSTPEDPTTQAPRSLVLQGAGQLEPDVKSPSPMHPASATPPPATPPPADSPPPQTISLAREKLILRVLTSAAFVVILNETLMMNALPPLMEVFGITARSGQWLTTGFMLTMAVVIPLTGWLLQRLSLRTAFLGAMGTFLVGTTLAALAPTFSVLLVARVIQATGTAVMMPLLMTTIMTLVPIERRGRVMGNLTLAMSVAPALGPAVSGLVLQFASWRWLFGLVIPIALVMTILGARGLGVTEPGRRAPLDVLSVLLTAIGFGGLVYGLSTLGGEGEEMLLPPAWVLAIGVTALALFVWRQLHLQQAKEPLLDLRVLASYRYVAALVLLCLSFMAMMGTMLLVPIALQQVRGMSTLESGLMLMPGAVAMGLMGPMVGRLFDRFGPRVLVLPGSLVLLGSLVSLALGLLDAPWWLVLVMLIVMSLSLGFVFTPAFTSGLSALPAGLYSHGSAMLGAMQQVAAAAGTALVVSIMAIRAAALVETGTPEVQATGQGVLAGITVSAALCVVVVILGATLRRRAAGEAASRQP